MRSWESCTEVSGLEIRKWSNVGVICWRGWAFAAPNEKAKKRANKNRVARMSEVGLKEDNIE